ncbi:tripartite ATP-independent transporter DctM subunit [Anaerospora hongkongensis]|uniref:Tripartite ATP-independent transporter DctM subunit n=1 Tax=Anaerospora hongkongensis TaxID=244830 RepID=A0A4R1Q204_9FIRM|nr:TRAP transporter large permease [Anaerospora hongkongensis]TCL38540.1 tripartite ATP-independent transporter DctM subunit [Anaerospora hongkongensis]
MTVLIASLVMMVLAGINVPVAFAITLATFVYFFISNDLSPVMVIQRMIGGADNIPLLAIPFFMMLGSILNYTGITQRLLKLSDLLSGHLRGGLAQTNVVLGALIGGPSGAGLADAAMICKVLVPEMVRNGYSKPFAAALTSASALLGPILPPGIGLIIYGFVSDTSIGKLFLGGMGPGILLTLLLMITVDWIAKRRGYKPVRTTKPSTKEVLVATKDAFWGLMLMVIILGGIRYGIFTPTEAGAVTVIYSLIVGFAYRATTWADVKSALAESARANGSIMLILMSSAGFAWMLTWEGVASDVTAMLTDFTTNPYVFLLIVNVFLLILGMFLDGNAAIIVLTPLLMPTVHLLGIDPVHFGITMIFNLSIGAITPPFGTTMFLTCNLTGVKMDEFLKEILPFYIALLIALAATTYIPALSLILADLI